MNPSLFKQLDYIRNYHYCKYDTIMKCPKKWTGGYLMKNSDATQAHDGLVGARKEYQSFGNDFPADYMLCSNMYDKFCQGSTAKKSMFGKITGFFKAKKKVAAKEKQVMAQSEKLENVKASN